MLVTGTVGFIGSKVSEKLLEKNINVIGIENLNDYYDIRLKQRNLGQLNTNSHFQFYQINIGDINSLRKIFQRHEIEAIINLASRPGVSYSMVNSFVYNSTNLDSSLNLRELCREFKVNKSILVSTSSLYTSQKNPFSEELSVNNHISPNVATQKAAVVMAYMLYPYLYDINISVVSYFTGYGLAGRPDMSTFQLLSGV